MKAITFIVILLLLIIAGLLILQRCEDDKNVSEIHKVFEQNKEAIAEINFTIESLIDSMGKLAIKKDEIKNYYNYEITKIDSVYLNNGTVADMDSAIRYWTRHIWEIEGFFSIEFDSTGALSGGTYNAPSSKLVLPGRLREEGKRISPDSSW